MKYGEKKRIKNNLRVLDCILGRREYPFIAIWKTMGKIILGGRKVTSFEYILL